MKKTREYQTLFYASTQEGCPLCRLANESTQRYLDSWKYELFTDVGVRQELRRTEGFCHAHTWQLARMGASLPLAQAYRDIVTDMIENLQRGNGESTPSSPGGLFRRLFDTQREQAACPACQQREKAEERYAQTLRQVLLDEEFYNQFSSSHGLCLDHFRLVCELKPVDPAGAWLPLLRKAELACLQRLDGQLGELIRKHDYRFKDEARGQEMTAWKRAAGFVAGEERA